MSEPMLLNIPWWYFEIAIITTLVIFGVIAIESFVKAFQNESVVWGVVFIFALVGWLVIFYGSFIEPKQLQVVERDIVLRESSTNKLRVAVFSDIHVGPYKKDKWVSRVVSKVNSLDIDAAWIPGDFVFGKTKESEMLHSLKDLKVPTFAVMGNHDQEFANVDEVTDVLSKLGIKVLRNEHVVFEGDNGGSLALVGLDDIWFTPNPPKAFGDLNKNIPTAVMVHNPDFILDPYAERADLVVSAHTHGGQIRLPFIGSIPPLPTKLGRAFDRGEFSFGESGQLFITQGVGETGPRARLFAKPTIDLITIYY
jgi:uncharacterized protein